MNKVLLVVMVFLAVASMNVSSVSAKAKNCTTGVKAAKTIPDVTYPFTFECQHCSMKITIKTKDDWNKTCNPCACGVTNLDCYKPAK